MGEGSSQVRRRPIKSKHLQKLAQFIHFRYSSYDRTLYRAVMAVAFFGMLRASEYTAPRKWGWDPSVNLSLSDVVFRKGGGVKLVIKASKIDPFKVGATVYLAETGLWLCPVTALKRYCRRRGDTPGPLFIFKHGQFLTKSDVSKLLSDCFPFHAGIRTHSFRIGGATAAAKAGVPAYKIQQLGRWRSDAFKRYIQFPSSYFRRLSGQFALTFQRQLRFAKM